MKNKIFIVSAFILSVVYIILSLTGIAGISSPQGGLIYRIIMIFVLFYACFRAFAGVAATGSHDAILTGSLGLGVLAINEVYALCYIYLLKGSAADITVSNYSRNCAYLFFAAALVLMIPDTMKSKKALRVIVNILSPSAILMIFYGVIANDPRILYSSALLIVTLCILPAVILLITGGRDTKLFSGSIISISVLDTLGRLSIIYGESSYWRDINLSLYPVVYLLIGISLLRIERVNTAKKAVSGHR
ncbi:MAG: hypothetical protein FWG69_03035 [Oscillospiraceae bacterium]|nr:hypothetical protein [Oscillospiraceae bacterium]